MLPDLRGDHSEVTFSGDHAGSRVERATYERCTFEGCTFTNASFVNARFTDCTFVGCELSMLVVSGTSFTDVTLLRCRAMGVNWTQAHPLTFSVAFDQCRIDRSVFAGMKLRGLSLVECHAQGIDLAGCDLTGANFARSDLAGASLRNANLTRADFSLARNFLFDPRTNKANKTRINVDTAAQVLAGLGLVVDELGE